ncbi:MAG: hypothetical protein NZ773_13190 [Dehalococcoidia bacterium]|nr:hypothetical protein [Dehalococcoidia bacterium]
MAMLFPLRGGTLLSDCSIVEPGSSPPATSPISACQRAASGSWNSGDHGAAMPADRLLSYI